MALGGYDLVVEVFCRDLAHLTELISNQLQTISGVRGDRNNGGKIYKLSFFWSLVSNETLAED
jgi:hypothetical protein